MRGSARLLILGLLAAVVTQPAMAQRTPSGVLAGPSAWWWPSARLGGPTLGGVEGAVDVGAWARSSLEIGVAGFGTTQTEPDSAMPRHALRAARATFLVRTPILGERTQLSVLFGGGAARVRNADLTNAQPTATLTLPLLAVGAALRMPIVFGFSADLVVRAWAIPSRDRQFSATPGPRGVAVAPEVLARIAYHYRRAEPTMRTAENAPLTYTADFHPVDAAAVQRDPNKTTGGRSHVHADDASAVGIKAVDMREFTGDKAPSGVSVLVATTPLEAVVEAPVGTVYFTSASADVRPTFRAALRSAADYLQQHPTASLVIRGYTDPGAAGQDNPSLGESRGTAIRDLLIRLYDVPEGRVSVVSYGVDFQAKRADVARRADLIAVAAKP